MVNEKMPVNVFFTWDIHYKCNYSCTYCFLHFEPETTAIEPIYLKPEDWVGIWTDIYKRYGACHVLVTGGEPFTYPNFIDLISILSKMHTFNFSTNLSWDIGEFTEKIDRKNVKIESSFHPEFISLEAFLKKVNSLRKKDYLVSATVVAYPPFLGKIMDYKEIFKQENLKLNIYPYRGPYEARKYPEGYTDSERELLKKLGMEIGIKASRELMEAYDSTKKEGLSIEDKEKTCRMGQRYAKIVPNGDAYRCCAAVNKDWGRLGNIAKKSFGLLGEPRSCPDYQYCRCYKAMVIGEEERWKGYWKTPEDFRREQRREGELEIAKSFRNEGRIEGAINKIKEILIENPNDIRAITLHGEILLEQGDLVLSEKVLQDALESNSNSDDDSWIYRTLGNLFYQLGVSSDDKLEEREKKFVKSIDYLNKAIESAEKSNNLTDKTWAHYQIAVVYHNQKRYFKAQENIDIALKHEPENSYFKKFRTGIAQ